MTELFPFAIAGPAGTPLPRIDKQLFELGFVTMKEVLGVANFYRVFGGDGVDQRYTARAGKTAQAVAQAIDGLADAFADEIRLFFNNIASLKGQAALPNGSCWLCVASQ